MLLLMAPYIVNELLLLDKTIPETIVEYLPLPQQSVTIIAKDFKSGVWTGNLCEYVKTCEKDYQVS